MRRLTVVLTLLALFGLALPASARHSGLVVNDHDSGPGSLRAALEAGRSPIVIRKGVGDIEVGAGLLWVGAKDLEIRATGQTITDVDGSASGSLLTVADGADLSIDRLDFRGPGGFDITNKGGANAIRILIPASAKGNVRVDLNRVGIADVGHHGVHIDDLTNSSRASIDLRVSHVTVTNSGIGGFDEDGIRVDEAGPGHIRFKSTHSTFHAAGADGVELDERGPGDVVANVWHSEFTANGDYCSFRFPGDELEAEVAEADLEDFLSGFTPNEVECLEIVVEEGIAEIAIDIDDAFDIDEADQGSIRSTVIGGSLIGNEDEGLDYDEAGPGDIIGHVEGVTAADNTDEAIKYSEEDDGNVVATVKRVEADGEDVEFEEAGEGELKTSLHRATIKDLSLAEEDDGTLRSSIDRSTLDDIEGEETGSGDLRVSITRSTVGGDIELAQELPGTGALRIRHTDFDGSTDLDGVQVS